MIAFSYELIAQLELRLSCRQREEMFRPDAKNLMLSME
jgi:hypothetical protein